MEKLWLITDTINRTSFLNDLVPLKVIVNQIVTLNRIQDISIVLSIKGWFPVRVKLNSTTFTYEAKFSVLNCMQLVAKAVTQNVFVVHQNLVNTILSVIQ